MSRQLNSTNQGGKITAVSPLKKKHVWTKETVFALIVVLIPLIGYVFFNGLPVTL